MPEQILREVNAPYMVNPDDETVGRETIIIRRNGEPVAAVVPLINGQLLIFENCMSQNSNCFYGCSW